MAISRPRVHWWFRRHGSPQAFSAPQSILRFWMYLAKYYLVWWVCHYSNFMLLQGSTKYPDIFSSLLYQLSNTSVSEQWIRCASTEAIQDVHFNHPHSAVLKTLSWTSKGYVYITVSWELDSWSSSLYKAVSPGFSVEMSCVEAQYRRKRLVCDWRNCDWNNRVYHRCLCMNLSSHFFLHNLTLQMNKMAIFTLTSSFKS